MARLRVGDRVTVTLIDGATLEPNGRTERGNVYRVTPFGSPEIHFDDDTFAVVSPWQVAR